MILFQANADSARKIIAIAVGLLGYHVADQALGGDGASVAASEGIRLYDLASKEGAYLSLCLLQQEEGS
jgi:hypothetical protein